MITAVDTNVLIDIFGIAPVYAETSAAAARAALDKGSLVACEAVWAEVAAAFNNPEGCLTAMRRLGVVYEPIGVGTAIEAGRMFGEYRRRGGSRERVGADFLIGAHAAMHADRLLTRDRGFYRTYFSELAIVDPTVGG